MNDETKTKKQLIHELAQARDMIAALEKSSSRHKETDTALRRSEEMFRIYFELSNDIMFSYNNKLQVLYVSPNVERITGYKPEELIGRNFDELQMLVPPEDVDEVMENAQHYLSGNTVYPNIYRFITKTGTTRLAEVEGFPITRGDNVVAIVSLAKDITKHIETERSLRESEQKCRTALQHMPNAVCIIGMEDARYLYANDCFFTMTGYSPDEVIDRTLYDLGLPVRHADYDVFIKSLKYGDEIYPVEHLCQKKDGTIIETLISARPVRYCGQQSLVVVMTDMTSLKQNEEDKRQGHVESEKNRKKEAIRTLAEGIAHDLRNALTAIIGYTHMAGRDVTKLMKGNDDACVVKEDLKEVRNAATRASDIVERILAFSRYSRDNYTPTHLCSVVGESLKTVRSFLPGNIELKENLMEDGSVLGDPVQIHQLIINLCKNAVVAMGETGGRLSVNVAGTIVDHDRTSPALNLPAGPYIRMSVSDTGSGMTPDVKRRIYEPYFTTRWKESGSGLGLSVVHGIVKSHGGIILCTSSPGQGTVFDIYLPEIKAEPDAVEPLVKMAAKPRTARVLNMDDEPAKHNPKKEIKKDHPASNDRKGHKP
ncbi:MAG: PAS domain S-box protein [Deltaproteobacteria bacterium]|nr:PAS domain S-box protein [Deltaproteobacteria bacterium]